MNYFLGTFFGVGLIIAPFYGTWVVAISIGGLSLLAYYTARYILYESDLYQYVLSAVLGVFMAQFIYQMHGLFEMHFVAFIASAILITYQNWKLQIPLLIVVAIHHALFGYLQFVGFDKVYFTRLEYMDIQTFVIHVLLAAVIFFICGLWAYQFKKYSEGHIQHSYEVARLQEIEAQKETLFKANMELDKFVYSVSHDLRAPLTSMGGIIELTMRRSQDEMVIKHMEMLQKSAKKLDGFILDILDYSRNARTEIKKESIDFKEVVDEIVSNLKYMSITKEVDIKVNIKQVVNFTSDPTRLSIVLNNLISNAIRYQDKEACPPFVHIDIVCSAEEAQIKVTDNGIGISNEYHDKIFDMFYRVSSGSVGSGLGLYIVKEAIDKMDGQLTVESAVGKGSSFFISIPNKFKTNQN